MPKEKTKTRPQLLAEIAALRARLEEPEETVSAIRRGEVDAFVVLEPAGEQIYTLGTSELISHLQLITDHHRWSRLRIASTPSRPSPLPPASWFGLPFHEIVGGGSSRSAGAAALLVLRQGSASAGPPGKAPGERRALARLRDRRPALRAMSLSRIHAGG